MKKTWRPTNKWWAARVVAIGALITLAVQTNGWNKEEWVALIALVTEATVAYLVPNSDAPGGVPQKPA